MMVTIQCYTEMKRFAPPGRDIFGLEIANGSVVSHVLKQLGVPEEKPPLITVNGDRAALDTSLSDGDEIVLFVPSEGG